MSNINLYDEVFILRNNIDIIFDDIPEKGIVMNLFETEDNYYGKQRKATVLCPYRTVVKSVEYLKKTGKSYPELANIFEQLSQ